MKLRPPFDQIRDAMLSGRVFEPQEFLDLASLWVSNSPGELGVVFATRRFKPRAYFRVVAAERGAKCIDIRGERFEPKSNDVFIVPFGSAFEGASRKKWSNAFEKSKLTDELQQLAEPVTARSIETRFHKTLRTWWSSDAIKKAFATLGLENLRAQFETSYVYFFIGERAPKAPVLRVHLRTPKNTATYVEEALIAFASHTLDAIAASLVDEIQASAVRDDEAVERFGLPDLQGPSREKAAATGVRATFVESLGANKNRPIAELTRDEIGSTLQHLVAAAWWLDSRATLLSSFVAEAKHARVRVVDAGAKNTSLGVPSLTTHARANDLDFGPKQRPILRWQSTGLFSGTAYFAAAIAQSGLIIATGPNQVQSRGAPLHIAAVSEVDGAREWSREMFTSPHRVSSWAVTNCARDGAVYFATAAGIVAIDAATGAEKWVAEGFTDVVELGVVGDEVRFVGRKDVVALSVANGRKIWSFGRKKQQAVRLAHFDDSMCFYDADELMAVTPGVRRKILWRAPLAKYSHGGFGPFACGAGGAGGERVLASTTPEELSSFNPRTGERHWQRSVAGLGSAFAAFGDDIVVLRTNNTLEAIDARTGSPLWPRVSLNNSVYASADKYLVVADGAIYTAVVESSGEAGLYRPVLNAHDLKSGARLFAVQLPPDVACNAPNPVRRGLAYFQTNSGLVAFGDVPTL